MMKHYTKARISAGFLLLFLLNFFYAQAPKLDKTFRAVLANKQELKSKKVKDINTGSSINLQDIEVSAKGKDDILYSAIIYTTNAQALREKGILVQAEFPKYVTALLTIDDLETLQSMPEVKAVKAPRSIPVNNEIAVAESGAALVHSGALNNTKYTGKGVLVGVVDTGIDWSHPDFRDPVDQSKSRILKLWDQTLSVSASGNTPTGFSYGKEYTKTDIEAEIAGTTSGYVQEKDIHGHGTHVAGTAAGNGAALSSRKFAGMAPEADLVIVKAGNGSFSQTNVINAIKYLQNVATALNKPIVINMSLGGQFSAHDGTGAQEVAIDNFSTSAPGRVVALAAGNDNGTNIHSRNIIAPGASATITLNAKSNTTAAGIWEFLLYSKNDSNFSTVVKDPYGNSVSLASDAELNSQPLGANSFLASAENYINNDNGNRYLDFYVGRVSGSAANALGNWTITITNNSNVAITTDGWLVSSMKNSSNTPLVNVINGDSKYLVGSPSSAATAITVAAYSGRLTYYSNSTASPRGYNGTVEDIALFSSNGPLRNENLKPDVAATGHFIGSAIPSNLVVANNSGMLDTQYYQVMSGTSMASPAVAGGIALLLQIKPMATYQEIKNVIAANVQTDNATGNILPNAVWGYGKLDVFQAGASLLNIDNKRKIYTYETLPYTSSLNKGLAVNTNRIALRFKPDVDGKLGGFYLNTWAPPTDITNYTVEVRSDNNGLPGALLASKTIPALNVDTYTWNYFDLNDLNVDLKSGTDFHIAIYTQDTSATWGIACATSPTTGTALADPDNHASISLDRGTTWVPSSNIMRFRSVAYGKYVPLSVNDNLQEAFGIQVYPNPANEVVNVKLNKAEKASFKLFDFGGKLVKEITSAKQVTDINITSLPKGVYILNINTGKESVNKKIIKK